LEKLSTIKPKVEQKPEVKIEYNDRSYESYIKTGFADQVPHSISAPRHRIHELLAAVDPRKGPVERTVRSIVRLRAPDWNTKKNERKEFIYYEERWEGKNWLGIPVNPIDGHVEGKYIEVLTKPILDTITGVHKDNAFGGTRETYYIPFSKKNVDEIIANSARTDKYEIRYTVKWGLEDSIDSIAQSMRNQFSYDMFLWPWEKMRVAILDGR
jgi:hypothetical protein